MAYKKNGKKVEPIKFCKIIDEKLHNFNTCIYSNNGGYIIICFDKR